MARIAWPVDHQRAPVGPQEFAPSSELGAASSFAECDRPEFGPGMVAILFGADASVDDGVVVPDHIVVMHGRAIVNPRDIVRRDAMMPGPAIAKPVPGNERVTARTQAETETEPDRLSIITKTHPGVAISQRGQWGPAAIVTAGAERHP